MTSVDPTPASGMETKGAASAAYPHGWDSVEREAYEQGYLAAIGSRERYTTALERIANDKGHCGACGTPCDGHAYGCCERPYFEPDDPREVAKETLRSAETSAAVGGVGIQIGTRCDLCGTSAPKAFASECNRPECPHRPAPVELEERAREMLIELIGPARFSQTTLRVASDWLKQEHRLARAALSTVPAGEVGARRSATGPLDRDYGGRLVREAWVAWALTQSNPKPTWLVPYDDLSEPDKEADRQIAEALWQDRAMSDYLYDPDGLRAALRLAENRIFDLTVRLAEYRATAGDDASDAVERLSEALVIVRAALARGCSDTMSKRNALFVAEAALNRRTDAGGAK